MQFHSSIRFEKIKIQPYEGPHNVVGIDNVTIKVKYGEGPKIEKFEHIKSYKAS